MSSFTTSTSGAQEASGRISSTLMFTMIGCLLGFAGLVIGFLLVARKSCCAPRRPAADVSLPSYNDPHHHHAHPTATHRGCPVASLCDLQCPHCLNRGDKSSGHSSRTSLESLSSSLPPPPFPPAAYSPPSSRPRGPTSWPPRTGSVTSFGRASLTTGTPTTPTAPASAPSPSYYYMSRGAVGGPVPRYRQS